MLVIFTNEMCKNIQMSKVAFVNCVVFIDFLNHSLMPFVLMHNSNTITCIEQLANYRQPEFNQNITFHEIYKNVKNP